MHKLHYDFKPKPKKPTHTVWLGQQDERTAKVAMSKAKHPVEFLKHWMAPRVMTTEINMRTHAGPPYYVDLKQTLAFDSFEALNDYLTELRKQEGH